MPTFTIVARCGRTGMFGAAIATKSIAVGSRCLFVEAGVGAMSSQAVTNPRLGRRGLERLRESRPADATMADVLATEAYPEKRQILLVDRSGGAAAHTGSANRAWAGHITRADVACGGNLLTSERVVTAMAETFEGGGDLPLAERLLRALESGKAAGGEIGGERSAALQVVDREAFPLVDLRVDFHPEPVAELRRIFDQYAPVLELFRLRPDNPSLPSEEEWRRLGAQGIDPLTAAKPAPGATTT